jgi:GAF domain-containing protein
MGLAGLVAQSGQTINVGDTSKEPNWINLDPSIKSALFAAVRFENTLLGVIGIFNREIDAFSEEDEHDITSLANTLAIAIENNNSQEQAKKQITRISALHNIDLAINSSMDLNTTLNIFLTHVTTLLKVDAADVLLSRPNSSTLEFSVGRGFTTPAIGRDNLREGKSLDKKAVVERNMIRVYGLSDQEVSTEFKSMWVKERFATYFAMPLISKGDVVGVLEVFQRTLFDPELEWVEYFVTLAGQAAIAIDNYRMYNNLLRSNIELSVAYDATIKGWSRAMDLRDKETEGIHSV